MVLCGIPIMGAKKPTIYLKILMLHFFSTGISLTVRLELKELWKRFLGRNLRKISIAVLLEDVYLEQLSASRGLIPLPDFWGGYRLKPTRFEFWQGQPSRLHDRRQYWLRIVNGNEVWHIERLSP